MQQSVEAQEFSQRLEAILDPDDDRRRMANELSRLLLSEDDFVAANALIAAVAIFHCDPDTTKADAMEAAQDFGRLVSEYIDEAYEGLVAGRRKFAAEQI